jgi:CHAT domain
MNTFEITIQRKADNLWPVVVEQSASDVFLPVRDEGVLQVDLQELKAQLLQSTPKEYGTLLGRAVFQEHIRDAFVQALAKSDGRLHVMLLIEDSELKGLRWERLCAPLDAKWDFLSLNQRVPFSLYLPSITDRRFPPIGRRDLQALIVVANPRGLEKYGLKPFQDSAAIAAIRAALGEDIAHDVLAEADGAAGLPTLDALSALLTSGRYTVLHIVGHGQYLPGGETVLYLATADNQVDPIPAERLLERFGRIQGARGLPHFAFLSTCEGALPEAEGALCGLAQRLVRDLGMPAVLAMTDKVSVVTAMALAKGFTPDSGSTGMLTEHWRKPRRG